MLISVYLGLVAAGVISSTVMVVFVYRIGRFVTHLECVQLRITNRELMQLQSESKRQLTAIDDKVGELITDPRTYEGTRLELERLRALTTKRQT